MPSTHKTAIIESVNKKLEDAKWVRVLTQVLRNMNRGFWEREYIDIVLQKHFGRYDLYDAFCFSQVHLMLISGDVAQTVIFIDETPEYDGSKHNTDVINKLDVPFSGHCYGGGNGDEDGHIKLIEQAYFERNIHTPPIKKGCCKKETIYLKDFLFPLEIGYTEGSRTFLHLAQERGIARWPYGSKSIYLLRVVNEKLLRVNYTEDNQTQLPRVQNIQMPLFEMEHLM